ncbi:sulfotransferase domain-containing protein [Ekhidna sp. To15]|uniref:sulfotransferase domain-containing protein n=1 Tax=Ekhidna sp. To15 TaxID=3395267 RepID=UPI003F51DFE3
MPDFPLKNRLRVWRKTIPWLISDFFYWFSAHKRKKPDFLIIGVHKGGSTSMFEYISQHPEVEMARRKELNFYTKYYHFGMRYYQSLFPKKNVKKLTGEATPYYFFHPLVPERVKKTLPNVKIILLLRNPVLRAHSHYNMIKDIEPASSFDEAIKLEQSRVEKEKGKILSNPKYYSIDHQTFSYFSRGLYFEQLSNWSQHFPLENMLILKSEDLFDNTKRELKKVYDYLGLSEVYPPDVSAKNARAYGTLSKEDYDRYKKYFEEDLLKLKEKLGTHFQW